jgi:hypothetical protein
LTNALISKLWLLSLPSSSSQVRFKEGSFQMRFTATSQLLLLTVRRCLTTFRINSQTINFHTIQSTCKVVKVWTMDQEIHLAAPTHIQFWTKSSLDSMHLLITSPSLTNPVCTLFLYKSSNTQAYQLLQLLHQQMLTSRCSQTEVCLRLISKEAAITLKLKIVQATARKKMNVT